MPRPIYGYCSRSGTLRIDPLAANVVVAVLALKKRQRTGAACRIVRQLLPDLSDAAVFRLILRIRSHADRYRTGQPSLTYPPSPHLRLTR